MDKNILLVTCFPDHLFKGIANIKKSIKQQNAVLFWLAVGLTAVCGAINSQRKSLRTLYKEVDALKTQKENEK